MGCNVTGTLVFGIAFEEEGFEFPWDDLGLEDWWREINAYVPLYQPYTPDQEDYAEGWSRDDPRFDEYYAHRSTQVG